MATRDDSVYMAHQHQHLLITYSMEVKVKSETTLHSPCRATVYSSVRLKKRSDRPFGRETLSELAGHFALDLEAGSWKLEAGSRKQGELDITVSEWRASERKRDRGIGTVGR
jgi:hypothetical protein